MVVELKLKPLQVIEIIANVLAVEVDDMPKKERASLKRRGITPVGIKDGDEDHR